MDMWGNIMEENIWKKFGADPFTLKGGLLIRLKFPRVSGCDRRGPERKGGCRCTPLERSFKLAILVWLGGGGRTTYICKQRPPPESRVCWQSPLKSDWDWRRK